MEKESIQESRSTLWEETRITREISEGAIYQNLDEAAQTALAEITDIKEKVTGALRHPKPLDICMPVFDAVLAAQYYDLFEMLNLPRSLTVYEPCAGASNPVILAAEAYSAGKAEYLTINLNRNLRGQLQRKIAHLKTPVRIIEDHAQKALHYLPSRSFDVACFHHAVNDILQTAVSERRGMDTVGIDWFSCERQMIEWMAEEANAGRLDQHGKPELMQTVAGAVNLVRPGGFLIFDHYNWCKFMGVPWFPWEIFYNLIPMTRQWISESGLPVVEVRLEGVDPQWWLILRVI